MVAGIAAVAGLGVVGHPAQLDLRGDVWRFAMAGVGSIYRQAEMRATTFYRQSSIADEAQQQRRASDRLGWPNNQMAIRVASDLDLQPFRKIKATIRPSFSLPPLESGRVDLGHAGPVVGEVQNYREPSGMTEAHRSSVEIEVRPLTLNERQSAEIRLIGTSPGFIGGPSSFSEGGKYEPDADNAEHHAGDRSDAHNAGPQGRGLLRNEVGISAAIVATLHLIFALGIRQALRLFRVGEDAAGLACLIGSVAGIFGAGLVGFLKIASLL